MELASSACDRICNDLNPEQQEMFKHLNVMTIDDGVEVPRPICYDFDIIEWVRNQIKETEDVEDTKDKIINEDKYETINEDKYDFYDYQSVYINAEKRMDIQNHMLCNIANELATLCKVIKK